MFDLIYLLGGEFFLGLLYLLFKIFGCDKSAEKVKLIKEKKAKKFLKKADKYTNKADALLKEDCKLNNTDKEK